MPDAFAISVDRATPEQLNRIHEVIKRHANGWWHHHSSFWIVTTKPTVQKSNIVTYWRDLLGAAIIDSPAKILVLRLPSKEDGRWWATFRDDGDWFKTTYTKTDK